MLSLDKQLAKFKRKNELPLEHWQQQQQQQQSLCACSATTASGDDSTNSWSVVKDEVLTCNMKDKIEELEKNKSWHLKKGMTLHWKICEGKWKLMFCILAKDFKKHQPTATTTRSPNNNISTMAKDQQEDSSCQTEEGNSNSGKKRNRQTRKSTIAHDEVCWFASQASTKPVGCWGTWKEEKPILSCKSH